MSHYQTLGTWENMPPPQPQWVSLSDVDPANASGLYLARKGIRKSYQGVPSFESFLIYTGWMEDLIHPQSAAAVALSAAGGR